MRQKVEYNHLGAGPGQFKKINKIRLEKNDARVVRQVCKVRSGFVIHAEKLRITKESFMIWQSKKKIESCWPKVSV